MSYLFDLIHVQKSSTLQSTTNFSIKNKLMLLGHKLEKNPGKFLSPNLMLEVLSRASEISRKAPEILKTEDIKYFVYG